jgi:RHS repeat-associated protein
LAAETGRQGHISAQYLYLTEDGKPAPVAKLESAAEKSNRLLYIHADQRGAPIAMTDSDQHIVWQADVAPWGQAKIQSKDGSTLNLRLPGQYYDAETGLHDNFHRTYNPATGRYLQPDPLGYLDGPDPYSYVQGDPINKIDPLGLYQSDIHYYMTYFLAIAAGIDKEDARTIALAAQFVDDNPLTEPIDLDETGSPEYIKSIFDNQPRLKNYHFTLSDGTTGTTEEKYKNNNLDLALTDPSQQLLNLLHAAENAPTKCPSLQFFGEYLHAFQDTFSHRNSNDIPVDAVWHVPLSDTQLGIGHGYLGTNPDMTYNHSGWNTNEARTLEMEKDVYTQMINMKGQLGISTAEIAFSDLEPFIEQYNATKANEDTIKEDASIDPTHPNFASKVGELQVVLKLLGFGGIDMTPKGADGYMRPEAESNRLKNLDGLDQKDYPGTCITSCVKAN